MSYYNDKYRLYLNTTSKYVERRVHQGDYDPISSHRNNVRAVTEAEKKMCMDLHQEST